MMCSNNDINNDDDDDDDDDTSIITSCSLDKCLSISIDDANNKLFCAS